MRVLLSPNQNAPDTLRGVYDDAVRQAEEIYIATAYLMDWSSVQTLNPSCKRLVFLVGTDFGLTRKAAMFSLLKWIPRGDACFCGAVLTRGFHPKVVAWKTHTGEHYCLIGSSNLSKGGLSANFEANVVAKVSAHEFSRVRGWIDSLVENQVVPINKDFINKHYKEAKIGSSRVKQRDVLRLKLVPHGVACRAAVLRRRKEQEGFREIAKQLRS